MKKERLELPFILTDGGRGVRYCTKEEAQRLKPGLEESTGRKWHIIDREKSR